MNSLWMKRIGCKIPQPQPPPPSETLTLNPKFNIQNRNLFLGVESYLDTDDPRTKSDSVNAGWMNHCGTKKWLVATEIEPS